jgi:Tfp pilus assembly protein PilV
MSAGCARTLRCQEGFTLVETVVAFAVLALVMTAAVEIVGHGGIRQRQGERRMAALSHARSELARLAASPAVLSSSASGTFDDGFIWRRTSAPVPELPAAGTWRPFVVRLEVEPAVGSGEPVALTTVILGAEDEVRP